MYFIEGYKILIVENNEDYSFNLSIKNVFFESVALLTRRYKTQRYVTSRFS